jgi:RNA polymerase sigma-70 factor, ECF subfamily
MHASLIESRIAQPSRNGRVNNGKSDPGSLDRDADLMLGVREGDPACFGQLLNRHRGPIIHFFYRMVQNQAVAEELAQEVFLRVYRSRETYEPTAKFTTWLFRIATHLGLNWIRDRRHERGNVSLDKDETPSRLSAGARNMEQELVYQARLGEVRHAIATLPSKQRAAVIMHKYKELEYAQIAEALRCSEGAVKSLLFRAYESLRARLEHLV